MTQSNPIGVLLVDDHMVVRSGLSTVLSVYDDLKLVGEAGDGEEAIRLCERLQPDVILMDLLMPKMDGVTAIKEIKARWPQIQVIALTSFKEKEYVTGAPGGKVLVAPMPLMLATHSVPAPASSWIGAPGTSRDGNQAGDPGRVVLGLEGDHRDGVLGSVADEEIAAGGVEGEGVGLCAEGIGGRLPASANLLDDAALTKCSSGTRCGTSAELAGPLKARPVPTKNSTP